MFDYEIRKSDRAKHVRITVKKDQSVILTIPHRMKESEGRAFAESKQAWIEEALAKMRKRPQPPFAVPQGSVREYRKHKEAARELILSRLEHFNEMYAFIWKNVSIKNTSSRWGSCSKQGNLNFNYRLLFLPQEHADYVVVHELCHLEEFNHSEKFWKLVEKAVPDYRKLRKQMRIL